MSDQLPPHVQLIQLGTAFVASAVVFAAAEIGLVDHLAEPRSAGRSRVRSASRLPFCTA